MLQEISHDVNQSWASFLLCPSFVIGPNILVSDPLKSLLENVTGKTIVCTILIFADTDKSCHMDILFQSFHCCSTKCRLAMYFYHFSTFIVNSKTGHCNCWYQFCLFNFTHIFSLCAWPSFAFSAEVRNYVYLPQNIPTIEQLSLIRQNLFY